jgi:hypothetical protein
MIEAWICQDWKARLVISLWREAQRAGLRDEDLVDRFSQIIMTLPEEITLHDVRVRADRRSISVSWRGATEHRAREISFSFRRADDDIETLVEIRWRDEHGDSGVVQVNPRSDVIRTLRRWHGWLDGGPSPRG